MIPLETTRSGVHVLDVVAVACAWFVVVRVRRLRAARRAEAAERDDAEAGALR